MNTVWQSKKTYTGLSSAAGIANMEDLWRFARWLADKLGQKVQVDGVEFAGAALVDTSVVTQGSVIAQPPPQYRFPRSAGAAMVVDLADYSRWLSLQMEQAKASADLGVKILPAKPGASLPVPQGAGLLLRRDLLAFIRAVGRRLGFGVEASDAIGHRDTGHGFLVRRKGPDIAHLVIEQETKTINGLICIERLSTESPGNFVIRTDTTQAYENGTVTSSVIASGVIQTYEPGDTPDACAALEYPTDFDPGFDYGAAVGDPVIDETLVSYADFFSDVITAMLALTDSLEIGANTWLPDEWAAASDVVTGWKAVLVPTIGVVGSEGADNCVAGSMRWRAVNYGTVSIQIYWELQKTIDDTVVTSGDFTLAPRDVSDWIGPPTATPDLEESVSYKITRISINGL